MGPGEEREDGAGGPGIIPKVEVVSSRIVEVYGLFDETETEYIGIEIQIALGVACYGGHMMQANDSFSGHRDRLLRLSKIRYRSKRFRIPVFWGIFVDLISMPKHLLS
jgi:hypothetical protein